MRRISIGPGEVAGYMGQLRNGFEALGIPCEHFMFIPPHQYSYPTTRYFLRGAYERVARLSTKGRLGHYLYWVLEKCIRMVALFYAILRYDTFIFMGLGSFFRFLELPLLRALGKRVIIVYLGSDARPPYLSGRHLDDKKGSFDPAAIEREAKQIEKLIRRAERFGTVMVSHTGTAQFLRRPFVRLCAVGIPMQKAVDDVLEEAGTNMPAAGAPLRVLHGPSRPVAKGTLEFRAAVERLRSEGIEIDLIELSGVPNTEVLRQLARCDLVLDELYSDLPMATLAAEAALFAKPVIVGSLYKDFFRDNPDFCEPAAPEGAPTFFVDPDDLESVLRRVVADPELRKAKGDQARAFLETRWNAREVAANYLRLAEGTAPDIWTADPAKIDYVGGWGLSRANWDKQMGIYLDAAGEQGLLLDRQPELKQRILAAAAGDARP